MNDNRNKRSTMLEQQICRQFGAPATVRFMRSLPSFRVDDTMPEPIERLMRELEQVERGRREG